MRSWENQNTEAKWASYGTRQRTPGINLPRFGYTCNGGAQTDQALQQLTQGDILMNRIQSPSTIAKHGPSAAALFAVVLALAGFANADAMYSAHSHAGKKGSMKITAPTEVGGIILQPGDYQVKEVNSPSGPVVEFVHLFDNFYVQDSGLPVHDQEVVGQVRVTEQAVSSTPKRTQLLLASDTANATALEIRGDDVEYLFAPSELADNTDTTMACPNAGQQE
jgi:hypothetical protein